jgi:hypothetical protein
MCHARAAARAGCGVELVGAAERRASKGCVGLDTDVVDINIVQMYVVRTGRAYCLLLKVVEGVSSKVRSLRHSWARCSCGIGQPTQSTNLSEPAGAACQPVTGGD